MKQIWQCAAIAASLLLIANCVLADTAFSYRPAGNSDSYVTGTLTIRITGSIKETDYAEVMKADSLARAQILAQKGTGGKIIVFVELNSSGGRVETSLNMGRYLRSRNAIAMVKAGERCFSSCVYLLAGASFRSVDGSVGIHRPYDPNGTDATVAQQKLKYDKLGSEVVSYLKEMNIPTKLHADSMFISPERLKILTSTELQAYGLNANDPYTEEANAVSQAKNLGISRRELANREARANLLCPQLSSPTAESTLDWVGCRNEVHTETRQVDMQLLKPGPLLKE